MKVKAMISEINGAFLRIRIALWFSLFMDEGIVLAGKTMRKGNHKSRRRVLAIFISFCFPWSLYRKINGKSVSADEGRGLQLPLYSNLNKGRIA
jgi:hypothetical protein